MIEDSFKKFPKIQELCCCLKLNQNFSEETMINYFQSEFFIKKSEINATNLTLCIKEIIEKLTVYFFKESNKKSVYIDFNFDFSKNFISKSRFEIFTHALTDIYHKLYIIFYLILVVI